MLNSRRERLERKELYPKLLSRGIDANLLLSLFVGVLAIIFSDILEQRVVGHSPVTERKRPGFFQSGGIFNSNFVAAGGSHNGAPTQQPDCDWIREIQD